VSNVKLRGAALFGVPLECRVGQALKFQLGFLGLINHQTTFKSKYATVEIGVIIEAATMLRK
jgi:hypothetical protein